MNKTVYDNIGETLYAGVLPNGLAVRVIPKPGYARRFALFAADYGGADRRFTLDGELRDTPAGVAHFLEHKMFDMPGGENALAVLSARGASPNAYTAAGMTAYHFGCTEDFEENLRTLLTFVSTPYFTAESVAKEQGIIGQEIRMVEDSPGSELYYGLLRALYAAHPVRDPVAGTVESIARITPETLLACHRAFYRPSNMALCCVGDVDPERVEELAATLLPGAPEERPVRDYGPAETLLPDSVRFEKKMAVSAPQFFLGAKLPPVPAGTGRLRRQLVGELTLQCLAGESSPFYTEQYARGLLSRDFGYALDTAAGTATAILGGESRDPEAVREAFCARIARCREEGLEEGLFNRIKKAYYGSELRGLGRFDGLTGTLAEGCFGLWCPLDVFAALDTVTAAECAAFAGEFLAPERLALAVIRPSD